MASSASEEQSLSLSSTSGRSTTRFSVGSPDGDDAMALPSLIMADTGERIPIADGDALDASEDATSSLIIVDAVTKSLSSSLAGSHVLGATGSSESRGKSRSPPLAIADRTDRGAASTPPFRGTIHSRTSPAPTPPRSVHLSQGPPTLVTRKSSATSIRSDAFGGLASITAEQASAQLNLPIQQQLLRDRKDYGPLTDSGRMSPRMVQVGSMLLQLDDINPPLVAPSAPATQERTVMGGPLRGNHEGAQCEQ